MVRVVPILTVARRAVHDHHVMRIQLSNGVELDVSGPHPTSDGRTFGQLRAGDSLGGLDVVSAADVPYAHSFTYDILPDSDTHGYFAGGALIGSTLAPEWQSPACFGSLSIR